MEILHRRFYENKPTRLKNLDETRANEEIARKILELRTRSHLTQAQLAKLIGSTASVVCRLEDADYEGHSLAMLRRIAAAVKRELEAFFADADQVTISEKDGVQSFSATFDLTKKPTEDR